MTSSYFSLGDYAVFAISLWLCIIAGIYYINPLFFSRLLPEKCRQRRREEEEETISYRDDNSSGEYFLARSKLSFIPVTLSLFATSFSAVGLLGLPAEIYNYGTITILSTLTFIPASIFVAIVFIPIYFINNFNSIFEYLEKRFESPLLRLVSTAISACGMLVYSAICAHVPCVAFEAATGIPYFLSIIAICLLTIFYTAAGGIRAVVVIDTIQAAVMFVGIITVLIDGLYVAHGWDNVWQVSSHYNRTAFNDFRFDLTLTHSFWSILSSGGFFFLAAINNQATLQRTCSLKTLPAAIM